MGSLRLCAGVFHAASAAGADFRMDPEIMQKEHFEEMEEEAARLRLIELYRETVNGNLKSCITGAMSS